MQVIRKLLVYLKQHSLENIKKVLRKPGIILYLLSGVCCDGLSLQRLWLFSETFARKGDKS